MHGRPALYRLDHALTFVLDFFSKILGRARKIAIRGVSVGLICEAKLCIIDCVLSGHVH